MNEYQIALIVSWCFGGVSIIAYLLSWCCQWAWAWVDDSKMDEENWLSSKVSISQWRYPVYKTTGELAGYAKDKKHKGIKGVLSLTEGVDFIRPQYRCGYLFAGALFSLAPFLSLVAFKVYPVAIASAMLVLIAFMGRFSRRHKKMFDEHTKDKAAHQ